MKTSKGGLTIISGGQTGADQGALLAARKLCLVTGGTAPRGWLTEDGPQKALLQSFGLRECAERGYPPRTKANVLNADGTLIVGPYRTGGSALTAKLANDHRKPLFTVPYAAALSRTSCASRGDHVVDEFRHWLRHHRIHILNVAGNRESQSPGICAFTSTFLLEALGPGPA